MSKNNLDNLFQEKLADFQKIPDEKVWSSIAASLDKKKQSRSILPIWWKVGGVAAILAILFFAIDPFSIPTPLTPIITDVENKAPNAEEDNNTEESFPSESTLTAIEQETILDNTPKSDDQIKKEKITHNNGNDIIVAAGPTHSKAFTSNQTTTIDPTAKNNGINGLNNPIAEETSHSKKINEGNDMLLHEKNLPSPGLEDEIVFQNNNTDSKDEAVPEVAPNNKKSILEAIEENKIVDTDEPQNGKWSAGPSIAPVYFNGIGDGSPINSILASNPKTGNVTLSYGITVAYEISKKLSVRSGIHKVDYGYNTNDVSFTSSFNASSGNQLKNIEYSNTSQSIILNNPLAENSIPKPGSIFAMDVTGKNPTRLGTMGQQLGYLEVPLELNYAVLDSKFGLNLIGGISSLFLTNNSVILESSGQSTEVGEANNINDVNFSTNVGFGLNYKFTPKLKFSVEPVFKYQLNTFSNTSGNFNPYSLGVYSGFSLKF